MSSIYLDVRSSFDAALKAVADANGVKVAWENMEYANSDDLYLSQYFVSFDTAVGSLGDSGLDESIGIYQINVHSKKDIGARPIDKLADEIADAFKIRSSLTHNGVTSRVTSVFRNPIQNDEGNIFIPIDVEFKTFTEQRT